MATLLLAPTEGRGTLRVPRIVWTQQRDFLIGLLGEYLYNTVHYSTVQYNIHSVFASRKVPKDPKNPLRFFLSHFL